MRLVLAFLSAAALPALFMISWYLYGQLQNFEVDDPYVWVRTRNFAVMCFILSGGAVFLLGLPAYLVLLKIRMACQWVTLSTGFCLAAIPMAIFTWPPKQSALKTSASVNSVQTMMDGIPTLTGWFEFIQGVLLLGLCGVLAALAFWLVAPNKFKQTDRLSDSEQN